MKRTCRRFGLIQRLFKGRGADGDERQLQGRLMTLINSRKVVSPAALRDNAAPCFSWWYALMTKKTISPSSASKRRLMSARRWCGPGIVRRQKSGPGFCRRSIAAKLHCARVTSGRLYPHLVAARQPDREAMKEASRRTLAATSAFRQARGRRTEIGAVAYGSSGPTSFALCDSRTVVQRAVDWLGKEPPAKQLPLFIDLSLDTAGFNDGNNETLQSLKIINAQAVNSKGVATGAS